MGLSDSDPEQSPEIKAILFSAHAIAAHTAEMRAMNRLIVMVILGIAGIGVLVAVILGMLIHSLPERIAMQLSLHQTQTITIQDKAEELRNQRIEKILKQQGHIQ